MKTDFNPVHNNVNFGMAIIARADAAERLNKKIHRVKNWKKLDLYIREQKNNDVVDIKLTTSSIPEDKDNRLVATVGTKTFTEGEGFFSGIMSTIRKAVKIANKQRKKQAHLDVEVDSDYKGTILRKLK